MLLLVLEDSNIHRILSVVPIFGMTGSGKTLLARLVYSHNRVGNLFERVWVDVSGVRSDREIICRVLRSLDSGIYYNIDYFSIDWLVSRLKDAFSRYKVRVLVVLDDLSTEDSWTELLRPLWYALRACDHRSKILITSKSISGNHHIQLPIAKDAGAYLLKPLQPDQALFYFQNIAFRGIAQEDRDPDLVDIGVEISNKCAHNLYAIKIIASVLSSQLTNQKKWEYFRFLLSAGTSFPIEYIGSVVDLMLKPTPFEHTQPVFTYSSLFPLDYKFNKLELQQLWEVQGLLNQVPLVEEFNAFFEKLLVTMYFSENKKKDKNGFIVFYTIPTLMHEIVKHLASYDYRLLDKPTKEVDAQHLSFVVDSSWEAPSWLHRAKKLKSLLFLPGKSSGYITIHNINDILANLKCLQALDIAIVNSKIFPDSIGMLRHLRYLRLGISFESLPECITNLKYLATLDLRHTTIQELPESFHQLRSLRHLYTGGRLIDLPPKFGELTDLHSLDVFIVGENNGLDALAKILPLYGKLKICYQRSREKQMVLWPDDDITLANKDPKILSDMKLDDLSLVRSSLNGDAAGDLEQEKDVREFEFSQPPSTLKSLAVQGWKGVSFPQFMINWFSILPNNLRFIHISDCRNCQHLPFFGSLNSLESLELRNLDALEFISVEGYFPSLKYLILVNLPHLKGWSKVEDHDVDCQQEKHGKGQYVPQKIFSCLSEIKVSGCPNMMSMPLVPGLETLEAVDIHEKLLKHLMSTQESPVSSSSASPASPTLKELHINFIHELESLSVTITSLQVLTITKCKELINVLAESSNTLRQLKIRSCHKLKDISCALLDLSVLEELEIESCEDLDWADMMAYIEENGDDNVGAISQGVNKLRSLIVTNISKPQALPRGFSCLNALKELSLCWLYNLTVLPESIRHLTQLSRLVICYCPKLKELPGYFPNLKSLIQLEIKECPKLERRCKQPNGEDYNLISYIPKVHLGKLEYTGKSSVFSESRDAPAPDK